MMANYAFSVNGVFADLIDTQHYWACDLKQAIRDHGKAVNEHPSPKCA
jgi:hypothetical protein